MRCNNDIRCKIESTIKEAFQSKINNLEKVIHDEVDKTDAWKTAQLSDLRDQIRPVVYEWAKRLRKNHSRYQWKNIPSSEELTNRMLDYFFTSDTWQRKCPNVVSKKLEETEETKIKFIEYRNKVIDDTKFKVAFVKNLQEFDSLLNTAKESVNNFEN